MYRHVHVCGNRQIQNDPLGSKLGTKRSATVNFKTIHQGHCLFPSLSYSNTVDQKKNPIIYMPFYLVIPYIHVSLSKIYTVSRGQTIIAAPGTK